MTNETVLMQQQEVRRQAMLQAMDIDLWLPRQQLVNAGESRAYLLDWQVEAEVAAPPVAREVQPTARSAAPTAVPKAPVARPRGEYISVHDKLAALRATQPSVAPVVAAVETAPVAELEPVAKTVVAPAEPIPRFALQLLRADNCLVLVDLPTGEPFQGRDPDYQLLKDMLRAAGLTDQPSFLRQGAPITWPMLLSGNLMHEQHAAAARACVRDLLEVELQAEPAVCVWLLGAQAVRFASAADAAELYALQHFAEGVQLWSLPSLEKVLEQPLLKRDIWRSMCVVRSVWQVADDA